MFPIAEPLPYLCHSLHQLVVIVFWFVSKLLSHNPSACAPPLLLILVEPPSAPDIPRQLSIFLADLADLTFFPTRLLPREDCLVCCVVTFHGNTCAVLETALSVCQHLCHGRHFFPHFQFDQSLFLLLSFFGALWMLPTNYLRLVLLLTLLLTLFQPLPIHLFHSLQQRLVVAQVKHRRCHWDVAQRQDKGR